MEEGGEEIREEVWEEVRISWERRYGRRLREEFGRSWRGGW